MIKTIHFKYDDHIVRGLIEDNIIYIIAKDLCEALGYSRPSNAVKCHCGGAVKKSISTNGGAQQMLVIPERDVYALIFRSNLASAFRVQEWVTGLMLPTIRRIGENSKSVKSRTDNQVIVGP